MSKRKNTIFSLKPFFLEQIEFENLSIVLITNLANSILNRREDIPRAKMSKKSGMKFEQISLKVTPNVPDKSSNSIFSKTKRILKILFYIFYLFSHVESSVNYSSLSRLELAKFRP